MWDHAFRFAIIDKDPGDIKLLRRNLNKIPGLKYIAMEHQKGFDLLRTWGWHEIDILFLNCLLADRERLDLIEELRKFHKSVSIVILTGEKNPKVSAALFDAGADEYIAKFDCTPEVLEGCMRRSRLRLDQCDLLEDYEGSEPMHLECDLLSTNANAEPSEVI